VAVNATNEKKFLMGSFNLSPRYDAPEFLEPDRFPLSANVHLEEFNYYNANDITARVVNSAGLGAKMNYQLNSILFLQIVN
jgi:hypothetical protein